MVTWGKSIEYLNIEYLKYETTVQLITWYIIMLNKIIIRLMLSRRFKYLLSPFLGNSPIKHVNFLYQRVNSTVPRVSPVFTLFQKKSVKNDLGVAYNSTIQSERRMEFC